MIKQNPTPTEQVGEVVSFKRRKPEQSIMPDSGALSDVYDFIRMLDADGYPYAFINHGDLILNFRSARLENGGLVADATIQIKKPK